jgi:hypothetical protein
MFLYIAGSLQLRMLEKIADRAGANHFLCSFADASARKAAEHFSVQPHRRVLVDSGAYSAWTKGKAINLGEYMAFCERVMRMAKCPVTFLALDVIPGAKGREATQAEIQKACDEGWENYQEMKRKGIPCLMTFHQFEHKRQLTRIADDSDYFAVSPRKDEKPEARLDWLENDVFDSIQGRDKRTIKKKIHGLGVSSFDWMKRFPFFSVDNTAWLSSSKSRAWHQFVPRRSGRKCRTYQEWETLARSQRRHIPTLRRLLGQGVYGIGEDADQDAQRGVYFLEEQALGVEVEMQCYVTELWRMKGVHWEEQKDIKPKPQFSFSVHTLLADLGES